MLDMLDVWDVQQRAIHGFNPAFIIFGVFCLKQLGMIFPCIFECIKVYMWCIDIFCDMLTSYTSPYNTVRLEENLGCTGMICMYCRCIIYLLSTLPIYSQCIFINVLGLWYVHEYAKLQYPCHSPLSTPLAKLAEAKTGSGQSWLGGHEFNSSSTHETCLQCYAMSGLGTSLPNTPSKAYSFIYMMCHLLRAIQIR